MVAPNGAMAQIYIQNGLTLKDGSVLDGTWNNPPRWQDVQPAAQAFYEKDYVFAVLVRYQGSNGYRVYTGGGDTQDLETFFSGMASAFPDAVERIRNLDSERSGDIILLSEYFEIGNSYYFSDETHKGEHGHLYKDDTYIPLIFAGPTIKKNVALNTPARNIDMARTLADLLGFSMPYADGVVLDIKTAPPETIGGFTFSEASDSGDSPSDRPYNVQLRISTETVSSLSIQSIAQISASASFVNGSVGQGKEVDKTKVYPAEKSGYVAQGIDSKKNVTIQNVTELIGYVASGTKVENKTLNITGYVAPGIAVNKTHRNASGNVTAQILCTNAYIYNKYISNGVDN